VGIILSGQPGQRELALRAGEALSTAVEALGHQPIPVFLDSDSDLLIRQADLDVALIASQGRYGADGCVQGLMEMLGIPYTGSGVLAAAVGANLTKAKEILRLHNLPTAPGYVYDGLSGESLKRRHGAFGYPVSVRPVGEASALPFSIAHDELELECAADDALRCDDQVLIERHAPGRHYWVGVVDRSALGIIEAGADKHAGFLRMDATRQDRARRLPEERLRSVLQLGARAYEAIGCEGAACVRVQVCNRGNEIVHEVDPAPALTANSPIGRIAHNAGVQFPELVRRVLAGARLRAHGKRENRRQAQVRFDGPDRRRPAAALTH